MIDYGQMTANKDTAIINMLQDLVDSKESAEKQLCLFESILSKNNIYFLLFDAAGSVCRHNIPDKKKLSTLDDCEYILHKKNIAQIKKLMELSLSSETEDIETTLKNDLLEFTFFASGEFKELFFLQVTMPSQNQQRLPDAPELKLEKIQEALAFLDEIRNINSSEKRELIEEMRNYYLSGIEKLQTAINDPLISLCLDIIRKNLEEFIQPAENVSDLYSILTPSEIKVAEFIRMGKTSKDIADALDIAQKTVENHRNNLRDKLGLRNKGVNLRSYLLQLNP